MALVAEVERMIERDLQPIMRDYVSDRRSAFAELRATLNVHRMHYEYEDNGNDNIVDKSKLWH